MYKHILLALDLIDQDDNPIVLKAKALKDLMQAKLSIVHAIELPTSYSTPYEMPIMTKWQQDLESSARKRLDTLGDFFGVSKEQVYLKIGQPKQQILELAKECMADLILVGSHGRHGIGLLLLGSTANAILHHAECDVLAIKV